MTVKFTIQGRLPCLNDFIGAERTIVKRDYKRKIFLTQGAVMKKKWQAYVVNSITRDLKGKKVKTPVRIEYHYYEPNRKRDIGNIHGFAQKIIEDALQDAGTIPNDNWACISSFSATFDVDKDNPRIEVELIEV